MLPFLDTLNFLGFLSRGGSGDGGAWIALWGGLIGAVIGAGVSGCISFYLQKREHDRADRLRTADRLTAQKSVASRLIVRLIAIASDLHRAATHLENERNSIPDEAEAWHVVIPLAVPSTPVNYAADETALLLDLGLNEEFSDIASLPDLRNQTHEMMIQYATKREQMWPMLPAEAFVRGGVVLSEQLNLQTERLQTEMADVLEYLFEAVPGFAAESYDALTRVHAALLSKELVAFKISPRNEL